MWWSVVIKQRGQPDTRMPGSWDGTVMGDRAAKNAAKSSARTYIDAGAPGQPRLVKSRVMLDGSYDMTPTAAAVEDASVDTDAMFAHVVAGRDSFEGSPFYGAQSDATLEQMEVLFRDAGWAVIGYLSGLSGIDDADRRTAGLIGFGGVTAQAKFWAHCRRQSIEVNERWLAGRYEVMLDAFTARGDASKSQDDAALIPEARSMIEENWDKVMLLATVMGDPSMDVEGREISYLMSMCGDPTRPSDS